MPSCRSRRHRGPARGCGFASRDVLFGTVRGARQWATCSSSVSDYLPDPRAVSGQIICRRYRRRVRVILPGARQQDARTVRAWTGATLALSTIIDCAGLAPGARGSGETGRFHATCAG